MLFRSWVYAAFTGIQSFNGCDGQLITVTQTRNNCTVSSASSATPLPSNWDDAHIQAGAPFNIELVQPTVTPYIALRQSPQRSWLKPNGNTTVDVSMAAEYTIENGMLYTNGTPFSALNGDANAPFSTAYPPGTIRTTFSTTGTRLYWANSSFSNGYAQFLINSAGLLDNAAILVNLIGPIPENGGWTPVNLFARPGKNRKNPQNRF